jgi:NCS1 family nucleobase:cation symporter-1
VYLVGCASLAWRSMRLHLPSLPLPLFRPDPQPHARQLRDHDWCVLLFSPNHMTPANPAAYVVSFFLYWLLSLPTIWVPIHKLKWFFMAKAVIGPAVGLALFGWTMSRAGGTGPVFSQPGALSGSARSWQMLISISSCFNNMFTLITNAPDFASRARTPSAAVWPQLIAMPLGFIVTSFLGIGIASASVPQFGKPIWGVVENMDAMLDIDQSSKTRAGLAFISLGFIWVQLFL